MSADGAMPRIYTLEEKVSLVTKVDQLLRAGLGKTAAAEAAGTNWSSYTNWIKAGIRPAQRPAPVQRTPEEKARLVAAVQAHVGHGLTVRNACREVGIDEERFYIWRKQLAPPAALRPVEVLGVTSTALVPVPTAALVPAAPTALALSAPSATEDRGDTETAGLCLVAPGGYRIEGLGVETAAALLRALA